MGTCMSLKDNESEDGRKSKEKEFPPIIVKFT